MLVFCMGFELFFTHHHAIGASGETGDDEKIDNQSVDKLLAALKKVVSIGIW